MWNLATAPVWSDLLHVTLWRNDWFLHSFCNFLKSNAFGENFIRTKFILHKIFFQMSTLSSRKTLGYSSIYVEKIVINHLWEDMTILRGRGFQATKININFFVRNELLNIFHITIFSKKTIFSKIIMKSNFWRSYYFSGNGMSDNKSEYNLFCRKWSTEYGFEIFSPKTSYRLNESQKISCRGTFSPVSVVLLDRLFLKKNKVTQCVNSHQPWAFHENRFKTASCIATEIIITNWKSRSVIF